MHVADARAVRAQGRDALAVRRDFQRHVEIALPLAAEHHARRALVVPRALEVERHFAGGGEFHFRLQLVAGRRNDGVAIRSIA
jgi:hypothetical protein